MLLLFILIQAFQLFFSNLIKDKGNSSINFEFLNQMCDNYSCKGRLIAKIGKRIWVPRLQHAPINSISSICLKLGFDDMMGFFWKCH